MKKQESSYYLGNRDKLPVVLETEYNDKVVTSELPWDVSGTDLVHAFYSACRMYFSSDEIVKVMTRFVSNNKEICDYNNPLTDNFRLTLKTSNIVFSITLKEHESNMYDIMTAFHVTCVALTYSEQSIRPMIINYLQEYLDQKIDLS